MYQYKSQLTLRIAELEQQLEKAKNERNGELFEKLKRELYSEIIFLMAQERIAFNIYHNGGKLP